MHRIKTLLDNGKQEQGLAAFLAFQKALTPKNPPRVCNVSPKGIEHGWADPATHQRKDSQKNVIFYGVDFDPSNKARLRLETQDNSGKTIRTVSEHLAVTSPYLAQADVSAGSGITFQPGETRLVLLFDGKAIATVLVLWDAKPPRQTTTTTTTRPPPPPRTGPPEFGGGGARR